MFRFKRKRKYKDYEIHPEDIFIDVFNVSQLNRQQFEGVFEKPIPKKNLIWVASLFSLFIFIFFVKLFSLQVIHGDDFLRKSQKNLLRTKPLFAERGLIYDRDGTELAWNREPEQGEDFLYRDYIKKEGFGHILGYVNYPKKDEKGFYWRTEVEGQAALEKKYNERLSGENGLLLFEVDALGNKISENNIQPAVPGKNIYTTLDAKLQNFLYLAIQKQAEETDFQAGAGGIMDIHTGELLALVSYPEYDPHTLAEGKDQEKISQFFQNPQKPFLNRFISGLYSPGSIVKPFIALGALNEGIISEHTTIMSNGGIKIPNKYNPSKFSYFKDWKAGGHGLTDVRKAIAESVNTFFYAIGGGYQDQEGLGITKIEDYLRSFDIAEKTGIDFGNEHVGTIPNPEWKKKMYQDGTWRLGDTYITSIGQFGFQVSPVQMLRAVATLANGGILYEPILVKKEANKKPVEKQIKEKDYRIIQEAMRDTVTKGTAQNINVDFMDFAAKTGTAQVGVHNEFYNSWIIGFFPAHNPKYAFVIVMEKGKKGESGSASRAMKTFIDLVQENYPEFWEEVKSDL